MGMLKTLKSWGRGFDSTSEGAKTTLKLENSVLQFIQAGRAGREGKGGYKIQKLVDPSRQSQGEGAR